MRESLKKSVADSNARGFEKYPKGSIVLCNACAKPIFKLDRAICLGDGAARTASALVPLIVADVHALAAREDIDGGLRGTITAWTLAERTAHVKLLREVRAGDPMLCPVCGDCFVQVLAVTKHEVLDRAYTLELLTVPPTGGAKPAPISGRQIGADKGWLH